MYMPTTARFTAPRSTLLFVGALALSACSSDVTSPSRLAAGDASFGKGTHFNPGIGNKPVLAAGVAAVYTFTVNPAVENRLDMGTQTLELPANAICALDSGYGAAYWNAPCAPLTVPITITATVIGTGSYPRVEFQPAMRFNPAAGDVEIYMFAKHASLLDAQRFKVLYCSTMSVSSCEDESLTDASLATHYSRHENEVYRKIKHFSGYVVAEKAEDGTLTIGVEVPAPVLMRGTEAPSVSEPGQTTRSSRKRSGYIIASS